MQPNMTHLSAPWLEQHFPLAQWSPSTGVKVEDELGAVGELAI